MIEENKYRTDMMNKHFNKEPVMTKEDKGNFENSKIIGFLIIFIMYM